MSKLEQLLDGSTALAQECIAIFGQQNADSYKAVRAPKLETIKFDPKTQSPLDMQLVSFYHAFMPLVKFVHNLKYALDDMVYPHDEVLIHVDRSPAFVLDLEHRLADRKAQVSAHYAQLERDNRAIINAYCQQLTAEDSVPIGHIELVYKCMGHDFKFIPYGVAIMDRLFASNLIPIEFRTVITAWSNELKLKYLGGPVEKNILSTTRPCLLQSFNLIPSTANQSLPQIFKILFGVAVDKISMDNLDQMLTRVSKTLPKPAAFIVIAKRNNDFYYDLANLFDRNQLSKISNKGGVTEAYIDTFKTLQSILIPKKIQAAISAHNYSARADTFVLWTNDRVNFKLRARPVDHVLAAKILAEQSSEIVDLYNKQFEDKLQSIIQNDTSVSYKQTKYLSFEIEDEERMFIDKLCQSLAKSIKSIKNIKAAKQLSTQFIKVTQSEFAKFKPFQAAEPIPVQALLVYYNSAMRIASKLEKEVIAWAVGEHPIDQLDGIVKAIVASNDNIYTKFISSYYLAASSVK